MNTIEGLNKKEINIDEILIELTNGNILRKNQNNNYFPRHLED